MTSMVSQHSQSEIVNSAVSWDACRSLSGSVAGKIATPVLQAWRRAAIALEQLARTTAAEVPDTAASMRLSGLEVTDAIEELSLLG